MQRFTKFLALFLVAILFMQMLPAQATSAEYDEAVDCVMTETQKTQQYEIELEDTQGKTRSVIVEDPEPLVVGENDFVIENDGDIVFRSFIPEETSSYLFSSTTDGLDIDWESFGFIPDYTNFAYLLDSEGNLLASAETNQVGFQIAYKLTEGLTYFFGVQYNEYLKEIPFFEVPIMTGTIPVTIRKTGDACGDHLLWTYDLLSKTLTITGIGDMWDFSLNGTVPWYEDREQIETIVLPEGLSSIGEYAFLDCKGLRGITIPDSVISIGDGAFVNCTGLTEITIPNSVTQIGTAQTEMIFSLYELPRIGAFEACTELTKIIIPNSVTTIGSGAFRDCTGLTTVTMSSALTTIRGSVFENCTGLTEIIIPDSVTNIDWCAFANCTGLTEIIIPDSVTSIALYAFADCTALKSVKIGEGVKCLQGFTGCTEITEITIPDSVTSIGEEAFRDCTGLTSIIIPDSVTSIDSSAFCDCKNLTMVTLGNGLTTISFSAFKNCTGLTEITISDTVTNIGENAFEGCTGLTEIRIPDGVTSIESRTFSSCSNLVSVIIPYCITNIDFKAFEKCIRLKDVYYHGTEAQRNSNLTIKGGNDYLLNATWHYLPDATPTPTPTPKPTATPVPALNGTVELNPNDVQLNGKTPYRVYNGKAQTPGVIVKDKNGKTVGASKYIVSYRNNMQPGTAYADVTMKDTGAKTSVWFKIYLPPTTETTVENVGDGIKISWKKVDGAKGYVIYRRAWNLVDKGWTTFERWNNTKNTTWIDKKVYAGTRYQYGIKAYFSDPMDNYNLGLVGPLKTTVRITSRTLNSVTPGSRKLTVKWTGSKLFTGYEVQVATDANFTKDVKTVTVEKAKTYQTVVKGLKKATTYYVRIRSYHIFEGTTYYGGWSNVLTGKTK